MVGIDAEPGCAGGEACILPCSPLHGSAGIIAASCPNGLHHRFGAVAFGCAITEEIVDLHIHILLQRQLQIGHTQLFTLIDVRSTLHTVEHGRQHLGRLHTVIHRITPTGNDSGQVMVIEEQAVPALPCQLLLPASEALLQLYQRQGSIVPFLPAGLIQTHMFKLEHHAQLGAIGRAVQLCPFHIGAPCLAHGDQTFFDEGFFGQLTQEVMKQGAVSGDLQIRILCDLIDHIQPEAFHALIHPKTDEAVKSLTDLGIFPVQIRLLRHKLVEVPLSQLRHKGPGRSAKDGHHIIGRGNTVTVPPDEIIVVGIILPLQRLLKPNVLIGAMVQHQIHDDGNISFPSLADQLLHILHRAEHGVDGAVVGHIVAVVHLGRSANRTQPNAVNAQLLQIIQMRDDALQVTHTAAGGILKAFGVDLIEDSRLPPAPFGFIQNHKWVTPFQSLQKHAEFR